MAVLGATGAVGQRLVGLLAGHPWFEIAALFASEQRDGLPYGDAAHWLLPDPPPPGVLRMPVQKPCPEGLEADLVFSALETGAASTLEPLFRDAGFTVVSNASAFRDDPEVPLVIPEVNAGHLALADRQRKRHGGCIVTNPNCSTIGLCLSLEPLRRAFGLRRVLVTTLQALSGAGHPGVPSLDALDNVLPSIAGEVEKLEREPLKIFGRLGASGVEPGDLTVGAQCNRVPVRDGHLLSVSVETERPATPGEAEAAFAAYESPLASRGLPSAPLRPVVLTGGAMRPQPALDREASGGMAVTVGQLRRCPVLGLRYVALVHNTLRGAAGGTLLIGELLAGRGGG